MTDGMVMKVDAFAQRDQLGATSKAPRWVIAYKYETEQQPTVLNDVRWQVGKGGSLTPVGDLEPVFIGGVTVTTSRCTTSTRSTGSTSTSATRSSSSAPAK